MTVGEQMARLGNVPPNHLIGIEDMDTGWFLEIRGMVQADMPEGTIILLQCGTAYHAAREMCSETRPLDSQKNVK